MFKKKVIVQVASSDYCRNAQKGSLDSIHRDYTIQDTLKYTLYTLLIKYTIERKFSRFFLLTTLINFVVSKTTKLIFAWLTSTRGHANADLLVSCFRVNTTVKWQLIIAMPRGLDRGLVQSGWRWDSIETMTMSPTPCIRVATNNSNYSVFE